jgi:uncharacterized protein (DUF1330 family)
MAPSATTRHGAIHAQQLFGEFPSMEAARSFYHSPEYQEAKEMRAPISEAQFIVVQGVG